MSRGLKVTLLFFTLFLMLSGCKPTTYRREDEGRKLSMHPGQSFLVVLDGNPTTGYTWELKSLNESVVKLEGMPEYSSGGSQAGAGGSYVFRFRTVAAGETDLVLVYHRPWEEGVEPLETFRLTIEVN